MYPTSINIPLLKGSLNYQHSLFLVTAFETGSFYVSQAQ